jgi:hypothetical protein
MIKFNFFCTVFFYVFLRQNENNFFFLNMSVEVSWLGNVIPRKTSEPYFTFTRTLHIVFLIVCNGETILF